jgi:ATP-dependent DNA helicase RecQ
MPKEAPSQARRIHWADGTTKRDGWTARYSEAGAGFRCDVKSGDYKGSVLNTAARDLTTIWIARTPRDARGSEAQQAVGQLLRKLLQRGTTPPLDPLVERALLERCGFDLRTSELPGDLTARWSRRPFPGEAEGATAVRDATWNLDPSLTWDSPRETDFLNRWVPSTLGAAAARWFIPQAPLDGLLTSFDDVEPGSRRIDFLLSAPWLERPVAIEIDGSDHVAAVDRARDAALSALGIEVIRIPNDEVDRGSGASLERVTRAWRPAPVADASLSDLLLAGAACHRFLAAISEAIICGLLPEHHWSINVEDPTGSIYQVAPRLLSFLHALGELRAPGVVPDSVTLTFDGTTVAYQRQSGYQGQTCDPPHSADLSIHLQGSKGPTDRLPDSDDNAQVVVRSAYLPVPIADPFTDSPAGASHRAPEPSETALVTMLQALFAKERFREGQADAVVNAMSGRDCAVLLPTGAGKSLIYQLAGLCMPGRTLIIDPLVSLIENQLESLNGHGIDRAIGISSWTTQQGQTEQALGDVGSGSAYFTFVAPERLQTRAFREAMRQLAQSSKINLAVVDEAHCVSEWGHDFRTAYLDLGRVLREVCRDGLGRPPTIIALTGTASRAVLRDVLFELGIDRQQEHAVIRPTSFDRRELTFDIRMVRPGEERPTLLGYLQALPSRFAEAPASFFMADGDETKAGLIFAPHVNGDFGVVSVAEAVEASLSLQTPYYSGTAPRGVEYQRHDIIKRQNAKAFLGNDAPMLVSTKAFGMGIDKPNVRYVVHLGMPSSLEGYYQEAGRAGRDGKTAICALLLSEYDETRNRNLLDDDVTLDAMKAAHDSVSRQEQDDISRQLFFYFNNFRGTAPELSAVREVLRSLGQVGVARTIEIPYGDQADKAEKERALHRLVILGVLCEYLVDFGSRTFELHLSSIDADGVRDRLFAHVERNQPARLDTIRERFNEASPHGLEETISVCADQLVEFIYDTVERARRRALREMWLAARESADDPNGAFRQRILDYLSQGDIAPSLERLIDEPRFAFPAWMTLIDEIDTSDLGEVRGNAARLLQSAPDHPGLLLCRGVVETLAPDGDLNEFGSALRESLRFAENRYGATDEDLEGLASWLLELLAKRRPSVTPVALSVLARQDVAPGLTSTAIRAGDDDEDVDTALGIIGLALSLDSIDATIVRTLDNNIQQQAKEVRNDERTTR